MKNTKKDGEKCWHALMALVYDFHWKKRGESPWSLNISPDLPIVLFRRSKELAKRKRQQAHAVFKSLSDIYL